MISFLFYGGIVILFFHWLKTKTYRYQQHDEFMKKQNAGIGILLASICFLFYGCASNKTFVKSITPNWSSIHLRSDQTYDRSWENAVDYLIKRFDMDLMSRADGYLRTHWSYTWKGELDPTYRVRVALKFSPDMKTLEVKTEAQSGGEGEWVTGYDTRLRDTIKMDLEALIGSAAVQEASK